VSTEEAGKLQAVIAEGVAREGLQEMVLTAEESAAKRLAELVSGDDDGTIQLWGIGGAYGPRTLSQLPGGSDSSVNSVAFSPDGHTLASGNSDGTIQQWDIINPADPSRSTSL
jgi:WD40 repeat protein